MRKAASYPCPWCTKTKETQKLAQLHSTTHIRAIAKLLLEMNKGKPIQIHWKPVKVLPTHD